MKKYFLFFIFIFAACFLFVCPLKAEFFKNFFSQKDMKVLICLTDSSNASDKHVNFFAVKHSSSEKFMKICFIDENISVYQNQKQNKTLKNVFFETKSAERPAVIKNKIENIFNNGITFDYYVFFDNKFLQKVISIFSKVEDLENNKEILKIAGSYDAERYTRNMALLKLLKYIYSNITRTNIINMLKSFYNRDFYFTTDFRLRDFLLSYSKILHENKNFKFADVPVINKQNILKPDYDGITKILNFFSQKLYEKDKENLKIEVLNASEKNRLAIKAANKLRENGFDVFEWGTSAKKYDFTIILDYIGTYENSEKIKNILNCGEIIFKPEDREYTEISVFLGKDCNIYDKLDRVQ